MQSIKVMMFTKEGCGTENNKMCIHNDHHCNDHKITITSVVHIHAWSSHFYISLENLGAGVYGLHREEPIGNIYRQIDSLTTFLSYIATIGGLFVWKDLRNPIRFF